MFDNHGNWLTLSRALLLPQSRIDRNRAGVSCLKYLTSLFHISLHILSRAYLYWECQNEIHLCRNGMVGWRAGRGRQTIRNPCNMTKAMTIAVLFGESEYFNPPGCAGSSVGTVSGVTFRTRRTVVFAHFPVPPSRTVCLVYNYLHRGKMIIAAPWTYL